MILQEILQKLNPEPDVLLIALAQTIDDSMLMEIAAADYDWNTEEYLTELLRIRDHYEVLAPMHMNLREVLHLTQWSEPDRDYPDQDEHNRRGHIIRAFACAALLRADVEPLNNGYDIADNQTLVQLLASLAVINDQFQIAALRFIAWRIQDIADLYSEGPFYVLALLVLILRTGASVTTVELHEITDYLYSLEKQARLHYFIVSDNPELWLLGLTNFAQRHDVWKHIGKEIGIFATSYKDVGIQTILLDIANRLTSESAL